ncbi:MAG: hypothetical protein L3J02_05785, partial [Henriciella sp.]|nr:hypothetical protein [Henriciella sp.]
SINLRQLNEQSLSMEICGLKDGEARASYKNVQFDVRSYKKLKMFVHAEQQFRAGWATDDLKDDQLTVFIRLGTDFEDNYYEFEMSISGILKEIEGSLADEEQVLSGEEEGYTNPTVRLVDAN